MSPFLLCVNNRPTNATDPTGLWTFQLGPDGNVIAIAQPGDTLAGLAEQGYPLDALLALAPAQGTPATQALPAGTQVPLNCILPPLVADVLYAQQNTPLTALIPKNGFPPGTTFGNANLPPLGPADQNVNGQPLGLGNCYGFVMLFNGFNPPPAINPADVNAIGLQGENIGGMALDATPNTQTVILGGKPVLRISPNGGLIPTLTHGAKPMPISAGKYGSVVIFSRVDPGAAPPPLIEHAGIALGKDQSGQLYVLQKMNSGSAYAVFTTQQYIDHWTSAYDPGEIAPKYTINTYNIAVQESAPK